jgi:predicted dehydrogenase
MPKFRVGIVGVSSGGRFLLERLSVLPDCEIVLFQPPDAPPDSQAQSLGWALVPHWQGFLTESGLNAVLFLDGCSLSLSNVEQVFQAGLPVGMLPPLAIEPADWRNLTKDPRRPFRILNPHHEDPDFRAALACIKSAELGQIRFIKRISWVGELVVPEDAKPIALDEWLPRLLWEDVDQLLHLAGQPPESVYAADFTTDPASYCLIFKFPSGLVAHLERRQGSGIPLEMGWTIGSLAGGYAHGHRHIKTPEGELYDVPVELPAMSHDPLAAALEHLSPAIGSEPAARHVFQILEIQKVIQHSARTGEIVPLAWRD